MTITEVLILTILIVLSAFFSGTETALMTLSDAKVKSFVKKKKKGAKILEELKKDPHRLIITILIGNNIVNISAASFTTYIFTRAFGSAAVGIATGFMTFILLIFGEITPKTLAVQNAEKISLKVAKYIMFLSYLFLPFIFIFENISKLISKMLGVKKEDPLSEDEIRAMVTMGRDEGLLSKEAAVMMHNLIDFENTKVSEIMIPKQKVKLVDGDRTIKDLLSYVVKHPYSRYPVFEDKEDNIVGVLDLDDLLDFIKDEKMNTLVKNVSKKPFVISSDEEIDDLLIDFDKNSLNMVIVVDSDNQFIGIVTIEDILEEIVGEVFDNSHSKNKAEHIHGKTSIEAINKVFDVNIASNRFDTIAHFVEGKLKRIPKKGEKIILDKLIIEVIDSNDKIIKKLKITKK
jgi:Mg2+/Co2+ transporter CorB